METTPRRRPFQFSIRTLLIVMTLSSLVPASWVISDAIKTARRRAEMEAVYQWFETLGYPDVSRAQAIRITEKIAWSKQTDESFAFLLQDCPDSFRAMSADLGLQTYVRATETPFEITTHYEPIDLTALAETMVALPKKNYFAWFDYPFDYPFYRFGSRLSKRGELFVIAWACARRGEHQLAEKLFAAAEREDRDTAKGGSRTFAEALADDIAHAEMWRAVEAFGDAEVTRPALLAKFDWLEKHFPDAEHAARARDMAARLRTMIREDEEHARARAVGRPLGELSRDEQIAELIFQLRDQNGQQWAQPGWCDVFTTRGEGKSPAHQLADIGCDAVPALLKTIKDERLTRSVGFHRHFYFLPHVLSIGDVSVQVICEIAGRSFSDTSGNSDVFQAEVKKWYQEVLEKGERQVLIEGVERGDEHSWSQAEILLQRYPGDYCRAVLRWILHTTREDDREQIVHLLGRIRSDESAPFLWQELQAEAFTRRLAAARALTEMGRPEGPAEILSVWEERQGADSDGASQYLIASENIAAIEAVTKYFANQTIDERLRAVETAGGLSPELRTAAVALLLTALNDTDVRTGRSGSYGDKSYSNPRVFDIAGYYLNELDPARFPFDLAAPPHQRDLARRAILEAENR